MGAIKKMQMLHNEFEAAVEDGDAELVLSLGPQIVNELRDLTQALYARSSTLTDTEREAVEFAVATADDYHDDNVAATLRGLLERLK